MKFRRIAILVLAAVIAVSVIIAAVMQQRPAFDKTAFSISLNSPGKLKCVTDALERSSTPYVLKTIDGRTWLILPNKNDEKVFFSLLSDECSSFN